MPAIRRSGVTALVTALIALMFTSQGTGVSADPIGYEPPEQHAIKVVAGTSNTCVIIDDGQLRCWGYNQDGQANVPVDVGNVIDVAVGWYHSCALNDADKVTCWGWNGLKQLDVSARATSVQSVHAGYATSCALTAEAKVPCWGALLNRSDGGFKKWQTNDSAIASVSISANHGCALLENSSVSCWGSNASGESNVPANLPDVTAISVGASHSCAVLDDATVRCWGDNTYGQAAPPVGLTDVTLLTAGGRHTCALAAENKVRCWGDNTYGQATAPTGLDGVTSLSAGGFHTCASTDIGAVSCWGSVTFKDGSAASSVPADLIPWPSDFPEDTNPAPAGALQLLSPQIARIGQTIDFYGAYGRAGQSMSIGASGLAGRSSAGDAYGFARFHSSFSSTGKKTVTLKARIGNTTRSASSTVWVPKVPATLKARVGKAAALSVSALPPGAEVSIVDDNGDEWWSGAATASGSVRAMLTRDDRGTSVVHVLVAGVDTGSTTVSVN